MSAATPAPANGSTQMLPALSAGIRPGSALARHPKATSASIWPMTWRAVTGLGRTGWTAEPGSATARNTPSDPWLFGTSGATMHLRPKKV